MIYVFVITKNPIFPLLKFAKANIMVKLDFYNDWIYMITADEARKMIQNQLDNEQCAINKNHEYQKYYLPKIKKYISNKIFSVAVRGRDFVEIENDHSIKIYHEDFFIGRFNLDIDNQLIEDIKNNGFQVKLNYDNHQHLQSILISWDTTVNSDKNHESGKQKNFDASFISVSKACDLVKKYQMKSDMIKLQKIEELIKKAIQNNLNSVKLTTDYRLFNKDNPYYEIDNVYKLCDAIYESMKNNGFIYQTLIQHGFSVEEERITKDDEKRDNLFKHILISW